MSFPSTENLNIAAFEVMPSPRELHERVLLADQRARSGACRGYRLAKGVLDIIANGISNELKPRGVIAVALHPGWVRTRTRGERAPVSMDEYVTGQQRLLDSLTCGESGRFFGCCATSTAGHRAPHCLRRYETA